MLVPATGSSCCEAPGFFSTSLSWVMMNRELQVQIHDKIFHEIMLAMPIVLFDWIELLNCVYKKQIEDKDVNEEDDG